jgi:hypothetical protein
VGKRTEEEEKVKEKERRKNLLERNRGDSRLSGDDQFLETANVYF